MLIYRNPQRQWLAAAEHELMQRIQEQERMSARIAELEQIIQDLRRVVRDDDDEQTNFSLPQLCLHVLSLSDGVFHSVPQVREGLRAIGVEVPGENPLAVLHTTLGRLASHGHVEAKSPRRGAPIHYRIADAGRRPTGWET